GRGRPRRQRLDRVLARHRSAVARRDRGRRHARLHPLRRRVRDPRAARRSADADDRPHALGRVLQQQRLADGLRRRRDDGAARHRPARRLQPLPGRGDAPGELTTMRSSAANRTFARAWLLLGYAFLYVPIVALVVYSFNDSPVPNVWRGFTWRWYRALPDDRELIAGLALSL